MAKLKLTSPWHTYYNELKAFFEVDPYVDAVIFDEDNMNVKLLVRGGEKAEALARVMHLHKVYGDTKLTITIVPDNEPTQDETRRLRLLSDVENYAQLYISALSTNYEFYEIIVTEQALQKEDGVSFDAAYVIFKKNVIQYYTDNIGDAHGIKSTLMEDIARDIFVPHPGVFFCTEVE